MENSSFSLKDKIVAYILMIITLGLVVKPSISVPPKYQAGSLKDKVTRITNVLWAIIFFCFLTDIIVAMFDSFFINRAILVKLLTRTALFLLVSILITDGIVAMIPGHDKAKE